MAQCRYDAVCAAGETSLAPTTFAMTELTPCLTPPRSNPQLRQRSACLEVTAWKGMQSGFM